MLNHLQDCADDYKALNRVYLPQRWMNEAGSSVEDLVRARATPALRQVLDRCLNATGQLLALARTLPGQLRNLRFGMEAAVIVAIAEKLCVELRRRDPLAERVELGKAQYLGCFLAGTGRLLGDRIMRRFPREANDG